MLCACIYACHIVKKSVHIIIPSCCLILIGRQCVCDGCIGSATDLWVSVATGVPSNKHLLPLVYNSDLSCGQWGKLSSSQAACCAFREGLNLVPKLSSAPDCKRFLLFIFCQDAGESIGKPEDRAIVLVAVTSYVYIPILFSVTADLDLC